MNRAAGPDSGPAWAQKAIGRGIAPAYWLSACGGRLGGRYSARLAFASPVGGKSHNDVTGPGA
jgi:hypothetical protein